jgi:hypothetical protein
MWTAEREKIASEMWLDGQSATQISKRLEVFSRCAVIGKMARLGLTHPGQTKEAKAQRQERARQASQLRERGRARGNTGGAMCQRVKAKFSASPIKPSPSVPYTPIGLSIPFLDLAKDQCHAPMENGQLRCGHKVSYKDLCWDHAVIFMPGLRRVA